MTYIGFAICIFVAAKMQWLGISFAKLEDFAFYNWLSQGVKDL
jgi:hypothetical protein